jgi:hypothetical protein
VSDDIAAKLAAHEAAVRITASRQVSMLVFLELSLAGYKRDLAETLHVRGR